MAWYTRQSTALIVNGLVIEASNHNNEFDAIVTAFNSAFSTTDGHVHTGTGDNGPKMNHLLSFTTIHSSSNGPGTAQDSAAGYTEGDIFWNTNNTSYHWCIDNADGGASWREIASTTDVTTLSAQLTSVSGALQSAITVLSGTLKTDISTVSANVSTVSAAVTSLSAEVTALSAGSFNTNIDRYSSTSGMTLSAGSNGHYIIIQTDLGVTLVTVPTSAAVPLPIGAELVVVQEGTSKVSITGTPTINSLSASRFIKDQYAAVTLKKVDSDEWHLLGAVSGA